MCTFFQKSGSSKYKNIDKHKNVSDNRIRIRFPFESSFWISVSGCKLTILPDIQLVNRIVIISASKSIKGFMDADFHLVFNKTLSQKNGSVGWGPGPAKGGQHFQNMPSLWRHLQKTPHQNRKIFFRFRLQDLLNPWIRRGFEQLSSSIAWRVIGLQISARKVAHAGLKGLK